MNYFKLFAAKEIIRESKDVTKIFLLEKTENTFFLVIQLLQSKKVQDSDTLVIELTDKRENRDVTLPEDEVQR